jgi:hypothetical protein
MPEREGPILTVCQARLTDFAVEFLQWAAPYLLAKVFADAMEQQTSSAEGGIGNQTRWGKP